MTFRGAPRFAFRRMAIFAIAAITLISIPLLSALGRQSARLAVPVFEVVSIKPYVSDGKPRMVPNGWTPFLPGGKFTSPSVSLRGLIASAYGISRPDVRVVGLPTWAEASLFSVEAVPGDDFRKIPQEQQRARVQLMLQAMLAARFQLKVHVEDRQVDVYELYLAPGGLKQMTTSEEGVARPGLNAGLNAAMGDSGGRLIGNGASMQRIGEGLGIFLKRLVVDRTGMSGYYNFDIRWAALETPGGAPPSSGLGPDGISMLISELREQLGLRVVSAKGSERFWVVDRAEKPTDVQ